MHDCLIVVTCHSEPYFGVERVETRMALAYTVPEPGVVWVDVIRRHALRHHGSIGQGPQPTHRLQGTTKSNARLFLVLRGSNSLFGGQSLCPLHWSMHRGVAADYKGSYVGSQDGRRDDVIPERNRLDVIVHSYLAIT